VLEAVKVWPSKGRARGKVGATANLDSSCARRLCNTAGRGEETGFQVEQRNRSRKQEREIAALKPLDNKDPIQGTSGSNREAESTDAPERGGLPRSSKKRGNARGAKGAGHRHWGRVNRQREEPDNQWKAAAFVRWHEPDDARVSCPDL